MGEAFSSIESCRVLHMDTTFAHQSFAAVWLCITSVLPNHALEAGILAIQAVGIAKDLPMS
jgi:hypothetical protein